MQVSDALRVQPAPHPRTPPRGTEARCRHLLHPLDQVHRDGAWQTGELVDPIEHGAPTAYSLACWFRSTGKARRLGDVQLRRLRATQDRVLQPVGPWVAYGAGH